MPSLRPRRRAALLAFALGAGVLAVPAATAAPGVLSSASDTALAADTVSLVRVSTPTRADKDRLLRLPLDFTEHAGPDFVEVVTHGAVDRDLLDQAAFAWDVEIADLVARDRERRELDAAYAAAVDVSPLPSGRDTYRSLADYNADMQRLAEENSGLVQSLVLPEKTIEGREVRGIEITENVGQVNDGKPVFLLMGLHHAREWPSGEHAIEFAFDLVQTWNAGEARTRDLLSRARVIVVPVVNPDGFNASYTSGQAVDLRQVDNGDTVAILGTPANAYKRKNCRPFDGADSVPTDSCHVQASQGGYGNGVDLNRNYGGLWGGPGAGTLPAEATYRGEGPFSEPETRNVRALLSTRQVTTMITNHTFSNLVLRPPGVRAQGAPPDEGQYAAFGARMAGENGYVNQPSYELYDTTGTTEDWSYYATGGYGFTFEIGEEFHPPYKRVVQHYFHGTDESKEEGGGGNREAYFEALRTAASPSSHSLLVGNAPAGAQLTLVKTFDTVTSPVLSPAGTTGDALAFKDTLTTTLDVPSNGRFVWHVNPSTRPGVMAKRLEVLGEPGRSQTFEGAPTAPGTGVADHEFVIKPDEKPALLRVDLTWPTPDDMDLEVYYKNGEELEKVGSSGGFVGEKETAFVDDPKPGTYVLRVINFASVSPTYELTATLFDPEYEVTPGLVEQWTLICSIDGVEKSRQLVTVDRGQTAKVYLAGCRR